MTLKELCDDMIMKNECGDVDPKTFKGKNNIYYLGTKNCSMADIQVSEDGTMLTYVIESDRYEYNVQMDGCLNAYMNNTGSEPGEENLLKEINWKVADTCDEKFFNVECFAQKRDPFLLSMGASAQCVRKAINGVKAAYGVDENVGLENETCVAP